MTTRRYHSGIGRARARLSLVCHSRVLSRHAPPAILGAMAHAPAIDSLIGTQTRERGFDAAIAELAARQRGVVTRAQLLALGLTPRAITRRLERRRLHALHRGVYVRVTWRHLHEDPAALAADLRALLDLPG